MPRYLTHPRRNATLSNFFSDVCAIKQNTDGSPNVPGLGAVPGRYTADDSPLTGSDGAPDTFQTEAPSGDKYLIPTIEPGIQNSMMCVVTVRGHEKWFTIADVLPALNNTGTLLILTPKE